MIHPAWNMLYKVLTAAPTSGLIDSDVFPLGNGTEECLVIAMPEDSRLQGDIEVFVELLPSVARLPGIRSLSAKFFRREIFQSLRAAWDCTRDEQSLEMSELSDDSLFQWLREESVYHPILFLNSAKAPLECLRFVKRFLGRHSFRTADGTLRVIAASDPDLHSKAPECENGRVNILIILGVSDTDSSGRDRKEIIRTIGSRAAIGQLTIILDHGPAPWCSLVDAESVILREATLTLKSPEWQATSSTAPLDEGDDEDPVNQEIIDVSCIVARHFGVDPLELRDRRAGKLAQLARQAAIFVVREWTGSGFHEIGRCLGDRSYVGAAQAYRRIAERRKIELEVSEKLDAIFAELRKIREANNHSLPVPPH
jgi:hypothetical protein